MVIEFIYEPSDFIFISQERRKQQVSDSLSHLYYGIMPVLGTVLAIVTQSIVIGVVFTMLFIGVNWFLTSQYQRNYERSINSLEQTASRSGPWKVQLNAESMSFASRSIDVHYRWNYIAEVFKGTQYVHIVMVSTQRIYIPARVFTNEEQLQNFVALAQASIKTSTAK
jgi:hypothetical protein